MTVLPTQMIDRWQHRSDPRPGEGAVYWHMPMDGYPQVVALVRDAQQRLAPFGGLHKTPIERLHMTTMAAGPAADFTEDQLDCMATIAADMLSGMPPVAVTVGRILYHPEAIMLGVSPTKALLNIRNAAIAATCQATGRPAQREDLERWIPHITICYSTTQQPAAPLIAALGESLPERNVEVSTLSLIVQHGPERRWHWSTTASIRFAT